MTALGEPRPFERARDLPRLVRLISRAHAAGADYLHPGGMQWWLRRTANAGFAVRVWDGDDGLAGWLMDDAGYVIVRAAPDGIAPRMALLAWAEQRSRADGRAAIDVSAADDETALIEALRVRGYAPAGTLSVALVYDVAGAAPAPRVPHGYRMATLDEVGDEAYVALHRAAWSTVRPSDYRRTLHDLVTSAPDFRRDLVPVVVAADGTPAASCIAWLDGPSASLEIEPLGTHPAHRRRGLGRAIVAEVHRKAHQLGAASVLVWGSHDNEVARHLYTSMGMRPRRTVREYRRAL